MKFFADLHIHSKYSMATSKNMELPTIAEWAKKKGLSLVATGDFTHPEWREEIKSLLTPLGNGIFTYDGVNFILETEVNNIYVKNGRARKIHNLIYVPSFEDAEKISNALTRYGNLSGDGRPILTLPCEDMVDIVLEASSDAFVVPAHIWTPHFSLFGAFSGFDSIDECFGDETKDIFALETGLSSDPEMNWRISSLARFTLISNSDAHSPRNLGREANCLDCEMDYFEIINAIKNKDKGKILYTIEFFPQEGKYHYDGHRKCGVSISPEEAIAHNNICPVCGRSITIGVLHRIYLLADRENPPDDVIPFKHLVPLREIIGEVMSVGVDSVRVETEYNKLIGEFGNEFACLLDIPYEELVSFTQEGIAKAIIMTREGKVSITPGYDGVYGKVSILEEKKQEKQLSLF